MNPCLNVVELLSHISSFLFYDEKHATLASLARTCRSFSEPALNCLWRDQLTLGCLIKCMPADLWEVSTIDYKQRIKFVRELEQSDWARYDYYSPKIRRLGKTSESFMDIDDNVCDVDEDVLYSLGAYRPARILLPNLRTVVFNLEGVISFPCAQAIFGPSVTSVSFVTNNWQSEIVIPPQLPLLCSTLSRLSPCIQEVNYACCSQVSPPPQFFRFISSLKFLRILCLECHEYVALPAEVLKSLAECGTLKELAGVRLTLGDVPALSAFASMTKVRFCANGETSCSILDSMDCRWEDLCLDTNGDSWQLFALQTFTDRLSRHPAHIHLTSIMFDIPIVPDGSSTSLSQSLRPLFSCRALQEVVLLSLPLHALDDLWLSDAALAWNSLSLLRLDEFPTAPSPGE